jgi:hypothetical protein
MSGDKLYTNITQLYTNQNDRLILNIRRRKKIAQNIYVSDAMGAGSDVGGGGDG